MNTQTALERAFDIARSGGCLVSLILSNASNMKANDRLHDSPASSAMVDAGAPEEIEVTEEMTEAGFFILEDWTGVLDKATLAKEVYIAMLRVKAHDANRHTSETIQDE